MTEDPIISKSVWFLYARELHQLKVNVIELLSKNATLDVQMNRKPTGFSEKKLEKTLKLLGNYFKMQNTLSLRIQSKCEKIRTRKNSVFGHFSRSAFLPLT